MIEMWFAKTEDGTYIVSMSYRRMFEQGEVTMHPDLGKVVGLGKAVFEGYDDYRENWRNVVKELECGVIRNEDFE